MTENLKFSHCADYQGTNFVKIDFTEKLSGRSVLKQLNWQHCVTNSLDFQKTTKTLIQCSQLQLLRPLKSWLFLKKVGYFWKTALKSWKHCIEQNVPGSRLSTLNIGQVLDITMNLLFLTRNIQEECTNLVLQKKKKIKKKNKIRALICSTRAFIKEGIDR